MDVFSQLLAFFFCVMDLNLHFYNWVDVSEEFGISLNITDGVVYSAFILFWKNFCLFPISDSNTSFI